MAADTLSYRAAKYFGLQKDPRRSVKIGTGQVVILADRGPHGALAVYKETGHDQRGIYQYLTEKQRDELAGLFAR